MRLLFWIVIGFVIVMWLQHGKKARLRAEAAARGDANQSDARRGNKQNNKPDQERDAEAMVQCVQCGTHVPESEALVDSAGAYFCCEQHRRQHAPS